MSFLPSIVALTMMAGVALYLTIMNGGVHGDAIALQNAARIAVIATILQAGHFIEETATGLNCRLPELFGLAPISMEAFVTINLLALAIWAFSAWALTHGSPQALLPLWFLGVACVANAVLHSALSVAAGGYFPGVITSPIAGIAGLFLLRHLTHITQHGRSIQIGP